MLRQSYKKISEDFVSMSNQNACFDKGDIPDIFEDIAAYDRVVHEENLLLLYECEKDLKKTLCQLNAQKRGQEALVKEFVHVQEEDKKKRHLIEQRRKALDIEKKRSLKLIARGLPMPLTVKSLLKESSKNSCATNEKIPDVQETINETVLDSADKENHLSELNAEKRQRMMEEWNMKAKERFTIALQKDRQKKEYEESLKQLENAEKFKRRQFAQQLTSNKDMWYPCDQADRLKSSNHQAKMQNAVEKAAVKCKEHAIEDVEGYEDHVERKFQNKEFNFSEKDEKLLDCVPAFIQKNYQYLLEEEKFNYTFGQSVLDESSEDVLNQAYIESPPSDAAIGEDDLEKVIIQLKERRSLLLTRYEEELNADENDAIQLHDKAIGTEAPLLEEKGISTDKLPFEERGVCTEPLTPLRRRHLISRSAQVDINKAGFLAEDAKNSRQYPISIDDHLQNNKQFPSLHEKETPKRPNPKCTELDTWSSSSYCSLPSKHGMPQFSEQAQSPRCNLCVEELKKRPKHFPIDQTQQAAAFTGRDESTRVKTSDYIRSVAEKYFPINASKIPYASTILVPCAVPLSEPVRTRPTSSKTVQADSDEILSSISPHENVQPAEKHHLIVSNQNNQESDIEHSPNPEDKIVQKPFPSDSPQILQNACDAIIAADASEKKKILQQVISSYLPELSASSDKANEHETSLLNKNLNISDLSDVTLDEPYVYHDLSTIEELDSILTNRNLSQSLLKTHQLLNSGNQEVSKTESKSPDTHENRNSENNLIDNDLHEHGEISGSSPNEPKSPSSIFNEAIKDLRSSINEAETKLQSIAGVEKKCVATQSDSSSQPHKSDSPASITSSSGTLEQHTIQSLTPSPSDRLKSHGKDFPEEFSSPESLKQYTIQSLAGSHVTQKNDKNLTVQHKLPQSVTSSPGLLEQHSVKSLATNKPKDASVLFTPETLHQYTIQSLAPNQSATPSDFQDQISGQLLLHGDLSTTESLQQFSIESLASNQSATPSGIPNLASKPFFSGSAFSTPESLEQFTIQSLASSQSEISNGIPNLASKPSGSIFSTPESFKVLASGGSKSTIDTQKKSILSNFHENVSTPQAINQHAIERLQFNSPMENLQHLTLQNSEIEQQAAENGSGTQIKMAHTTKQSVSSISSLEQHTILSSYSSSSSSFIPFQFKLPEKIKFKSWNLQDVNQNQNKNDSEDLAKHKDKESYASDSVTTPVATNHLEKLPSDFRQEHRVKSVDPSTSSSPGTFLNPPTHGLMPPPMVPRHYSVSANEREFRTATPVYLTSSSDENLSELFSGSKIAYQSTPIKAYQDYEHEPGILEEPDLTLVPSESTIVSPEKLRHHTTTEDSNRHDDTVKTIISHLRNTHAEEHESVGAPKMITNSLASVEKLESINEVANQEDVLKSLLLKLKNTNATDDQASSNVEIKATVHIKDTKIQMQEAVSNSMISFLKHEMSCCISSCSTESPASRNTDPASTNTCDSPSCETPTSGKNFFSGTPSTSQESGTKSQPDFKQRTKRLWNNLEEVKQKKSTDEKKKQMALTRDRMKEYSKKLNQKKKTPKK